MASARASMVSCPNDWLVHPAEEGVVNEMQAKQIPHDNVAHLTDSSLDMHTWKQDTSIDETSIKHFGL